MPKHWRTHFTRPKNPSSNPQTEEDPPSNVSISDVTASVDSQKPHTSKHAAPVVHLVGPGVSPSTLPIRSIPPTKTETEVLLGDQVDLWDEAYKKLEREQPKIFERYKHCIIASGDEFIKPSSLPSDNVDGEKREKYLASQIEKRLKTIQDHELSTAGDIYKKIVKTVWFAKGFVGQAVSNEPHAALAWAGVSMLLPLLLKPDSQRDAATEGLAVVSELMLEYRVIEKTFRSRSRQLQARVDSADADLVTSTQNKIVGLYSQILAFQIRMAYYYSRKGLNRYFRDVSTSDDWEGMRTAIEASHKVIGGNFGTLGNVHFDNALEAQRVQLQHFSEDFISLHSAVARIENLVSDRRKAKGDHTLSFGVCLDQAPQIAPDAFTGRTKELQQLQDWLLPKSHPNRQRIVSIVGTGGMGKTQLSLAHVRDCEEDYSSVFWVNAKDETSLRQGIVRLSAVILRDSAAPAAQSSDKENVKIDEVRRWLSEPGNDHWLFIFDNYDDPRLPGIDSSTGYDIRAYFPHRAQGSILITTRSPRLVFAKQLPLKKLENVKESLAILAAGSGRQVEGDASATKLAIHLDGLPLALATAGAYLSQSADSFDDYLQLYKSSWDDLSQYSSELVDYEGRTLYSTWNVSFKQIQDQDPAAAELLKLLAYLDNQDLWYELFHRAVADTPAWWVDVLKNRPRFNRAISTLNNYSLLEVSEGRYSLHTCVHDWTLEHLNHEIDKEKYSIAIHCVAKSVSWRSEADFLAKNQRVLLHARRLQYIRLKLAIEWSGVEPSDLFEVATLYQRHDMNAEAEEMYVKALQELEKARGSEHVLILDGVNNLGVLYKNQGRLVEAEEMFMRALQGYEKGLGLEHTSTLDTIDNLGNLYQKQRKMIKAEEMYLRALRGKEKVVGPEHMSTLDTANNLGVLYKNQGRLVEAEEMFMRALRGYEKAWGPEHILTLETVSNLGNLYVLQGKMAEAEESYIRALQGYEKSWGPDHTSTLSRLYNLGLLYQKQEKKAEAEEMYMRALQGYEKVWGSEHTLTVDTLNNLGVLFAGQGKIAEAEKMYMRALRGKEKAWGPEHTSTIDTVDNLALLYADQGKLVQAEKMYLRVLRGKEKVLGPEHTSTLDTVDSLGLLYADQGKLVEAEEMYMQALRAKEKALGSEHTATLDTVYNLGCLYEKQGRIIEAEEMYARALREYEKAAGTDHPNTELIARNLQRLRAMKEGVVG